MLKHEVMRQLKFSEAAAIALALGFSAGGAAAQETSQDNEDETTVLNRVVVQATKREASILEVPLAVTVLTAEEIDQQNITNFEDYLTTIPGVQFNPAGNVFGNSISIRGVTDGTSSFLTQQPIATILDETPLTLSQGAINLDYGLFGVEQINVIKGPNSTLYGASSLGGTIKVVTQSPSLDQAEGRAKATVSSINEGGTSYTLSGSYTAPIIEDILGFEVTGYIKDDAGYIDDPSRNASDINDSETVGGRLALRFTPTDEFTLDLKAYYQNFEGDSFNTFAPDTVGDLDSRPLAQDQPQSDEFTLIALNGTYDFGFAELVSATSYFDRETRTTQDISFSFLNVSGELPVLSNTFAPAEVFSQELRLVSDNTGRFNWLVGAFYSKEEYSEIFDINDQVFGALFNGELAYEYETRAVFAELGVELSEGLDLTVGGRYTEYDFPVDFNTFGLFVPNGSQMLQRSDSEDDFSPRIALNYEFENGSVYAQASRGFRLGQVNVPIVSLPTETIPAFYGPDNLWNYEIGTKTTLFNDRVRLNAAAYFIDWTDIQLTRASGTGFTFIDNIGNAEITGLELETAIEIAPDFVGTFNIGLIDGELTEDVATVAEAGTRLPGSPELTFSGSLERQFQLAGKDSFVRLDFLHYGEYDDAFSIGVPTEVNGDYEKVDLRFGMDFERFNVSLFGTNIFDERPILTRANLAGEEKTTIRPRTIGASVGLVF